MFKNMNFKKSQNKNFLNFNGKENEKKNNNRKNNAKLNRKKMDKRKPKEKMKKKIIQRPQPVCVCSIGSEHVSTCDWPTSCHTE